MTNIYQTVRGTRDIFGQEAELFHHIYQKISACMATYGFNFIETPIFEYLSVFAKNLGDSSDIVNKEMYVFEDKSQEKLVLRPEGTASVVRALIQNQLTQTLPAKYYYFGPMFRYERPQKGRYRQFYQFGAEYFGSSLVIADILLIKLATTILESLGMVNFKVLVNSLGDEESRNRYKIALTEYLQQHRQNLSETSQKNLTANPLRILDSKNEQDKVIVANAPSYANYYNSASKQWLEELLSGLTAAGVDYTLDSKLVRGLDYYNKTVFELVTNDLGATQNTLIAGGRYDGLVQNMGAKADIPAVGFAGGVDRILLLMKSNQVSKAKRLVICCDSTNLALRDYLLVVHQQLVGTNLSIDLLEGSENLSKKLKKANKVGYDYVAIIAEQELATQIITIKNFANGEQKTIDLTEVRKAFE